MTTEFFQECLEEGIHRDACVGQNFAVEMRAAGYDPSYYNAIYDLPLWARQGQAYPGQHLTAQLPAQPPQGLPLWVVFVGLAAGIALAARNLGK